MFDNINDALRIVEGFELHHEYESGYIDALEYLIRETDDSLYMMKLGGWYYENRHFDLAEKYYLMAADKDDMNAYSCLGYIYYYGRIGKRDYKKAYECFKKASDMGDIISGYKLADMYHRGYYVDKDEQKYKEIIMSLYEEVKDEINLFAPVPEIFSRLGRIYLNEGKRYDGIMLFLKAKDFLAQRLEHSTFFGDLSIMKYLIKDIYEVIELDLDHLDIFDLYYILTKESLVRITYKHNDFYIESYQDGTIEMNDVLYEDVDDFFSRAKLDLRTPIFSVYDQLDDMKLLHWD